MIKKIKQSDCILLNLACGSKTSSFGNWINVDFSSPISNVRKMNILNGLKFENSTFDAIYSAQFIEHLSIDEAKIVLKDILRVLKPGGILRLVTPDFEEMAKTYLELLGQVKISSDQSLNERYEWIRIEMFDQIVRDKSGGDTYKFINSCQASTKKYIEERLGYSAKNLICKSSNKTTAIKFIRILKSIPSNLRMIVYKLFAPKACQIGYFRQSGEVHRYMHDIYSLESLLIESGFHSVKRVEPAVSSIPDWENYNLDVIEGIIDAPKSLYMEAKRIDE